MPVRAAKMLKIPKNYHLPVHYDCILEQIVLLENNLMRMEKKLTCKTKAENTKLENNILKALNSSSHN